MVLVCKQLLSLLFFFFSSLSNLIYDGFSSQVRGLGNQVASLGFEFCKGGSFLV